MFSNEENSINRGVSLIEMIVVVAIMAVVVGTVSVGVGMLSTRPAKACASNIEICLNRCRIHTMGKTQGFVAFYKDSDGIYMVEKLGDCSDDIDSDDCAPGDYTKKKIGKADVNILYKFSTSETETGVVPTSSAPVYYKFNRSDGSVNIGYFGYSNVPYIYVSKGNKKYKISVQELTGKVEVEAVD